MYLDYSDENTLKEEKEMLNYLLNEFCNDSYEREEMMKWINQRDIKYVYHIVKDLYD